MYTAAALTYGMVASFVIKSAERNRRDGRPHPMIVQMTGWGLMSASLTGGALLLGVAVVKMAV